MMEAAVENAEVRAISYSRDAAKAISQFFLISLFISNLCIDLNSIGFVRMQLSCQMLRMTDCDEYTAAKAMLTELKEARLAVEDLQKVTISYVVGVGTIGPNGVLGFTGPGFRRGLWREW